VITRRRQRRWQIIRLAHRARVLKRRRRTPVVITLRGG
jgi:hypothetical protein